MSNQDVRDVTILGAGPSGLSAAYYVGHRDGTVRIVESLEQIGRASCRERVSDTV